MTDSTESLGTETSRSEAERLGFTVIRALHRAEESAVLAPLLAEHAPGRAERRAAQARTVDLVQQIRNQGRSGLMEQFLGEYGLSTNEGIALMCLAEALLRVPDPGTMDDLIKDKIVPYQWDEHLSSDNSAIVNASTAALILTGRVLDEDNSASVLGLLNRTIKRLGEPVVRVAVRRAMQEMGDQFVLGQTIDEALKRGARERKKGFLYSYDMLGEAALTEPDAAAYFEAYRHAIERVGASRMDARFTDRPGVSIKLSALHPRFEVSQRGRLQQELVPRLRALALQAKAAGMGLNVDAEEANRLEITLETFAAVLADPELAGWDGFGLVVQAYGKRAIAVLDWLYALAERLDRRVMVRLVKGAYWDTEIKLAQVAGVDGYPVFTSRAATDVSYLCCARKLLGMTDRIYPQFATHNAQTAATILELTEERDSFEFQRLHGMGETLHNLLLATEGTRCRIYAPVGPHQDLLAYLVRRLLENGANSSFVNQLADPTTPAQALAADPFEQVVVAPNAGPIALRPIKLRPPNGLYAPRRRSALGWDLANVMDVEAIDRARAPFATHLFRAAPIVADTALADASTDETAICNPAMPAQRVGQVVDASAAQVEQAVRASRCWAETATAKQRAQVLRHASDLFETHFGELFALLCREAGKTQLDAIAELREAVDFLRYYALCAEDAEAIGASMPLGIVSCIAPWNFPLAIFTGQIAAALAAGNAVLCKPAETTPLIAGRAVSLLQEAGVPREALHYLPGTGASVGQALVGHPAVSGVCFTGSVATAQAIHRTMARSLPPQAPLIAETGGLNAAIVDSTALPEQAVRDVLTSAFLSAGQRCSAARILYVQEDIAASFLRLLMGTMNELQLGDPWALATDVGPVISAGARDQIQRHVEQARSQGRLLHQLPVPDDGYFVGPALISVAGIEDLDREVFGPVLHVARFAAADFDRVLDAINGSGYGLTFALHTRIDERASLVSERVHAGNIYINRNQVGAVVESQPFGGEGLSGTGPKAGGPNYLRRFCRPAAASAGFEVSLGDARPASVQSVQAALDQLAVMPGHCLDEASMAGPTGEDNRLRRWPRGVVLCLGPSRDAALSQAGVARRNGCQALLVAPQVDGDGAIDGVLPRAALSTLTGFQLVALRGADDDLRAARCALAERPGAIVPLATAVDFDDYCYVERHTSIDTTAAGGNASLLAGNSG